MTPQPQAKGYLLIILGAVLFGTTGTACAIGAQTVPPWMAGALRLVIGGPLLLGLSLFPAFRSPRLDAPGTKAPTTFPFALMFWAVAGVVVFQFSFFEAVQRTGVAVGTLVSIGSTPVFAGILGAICFKDRLDRAWLLATAMAILGCFFLVGFGRDMTVDLPGLMLALAAGASYAVYVAAGRGLVRIMAPARVVGLVLSCGGILVLPLLILSDLSPLASPTVLVTMAYLGIFATALSYLSVASGLALVPITRASVLLLLEPLVGSLLGICLLGEPFTSISLLGMALIFSGMAVIAVFPFFIARKA